MRVFVTAFNPKDTSDGGARYDAIKPRTLKDEADLLAEIQLLPRSKAQRKVCCCFGCWPLLGFKKNVSSVSSQILALPAFLTFLRSWLSYASLEIGVRPNEPFRNTASADAALGGFSD